MDGQITLKSVLLECLGLIKEEQRLSSKDYNGLVPKEGMEESWDQARRKVQVLKDAIPALESEPVRAAMANWQKDVMRDGPSALNVEPVKPGDLLLVHGDELVYCPRCGEIVNIPGKMEKVPDKIKKVLGLAGRYNLEDVLKEEPMRY